MSAQQSQLATEIRGFFSKPHKAIAYFATVDAARGFAPEVRTMTLMEADWRFYVATGVRTRKVREIAAHTKVAALVPFQGGGFSGYLRICGTAEPLTAIAEIKRIAEHAAYDLTCHWKEGPRDPNLAFLRIVPERIEYLRPGEDNAQDVTAELKTNK